MRRRDISGLRFGRLIALTDSGTRRNKKTLWICACDCGSSTTIPIGALTSGNTLSCGCFHRERLLSIHTTHGMTDTKMHKLWRSIKSRCMNKNNKNYSDYGGRGITICDRWANSFELFYSDMGECPPTLTIERKNNDAGYFPGNCKWATRAEQSRNKRNSRRIICANAINNACS